MIGAWWSYFVVLLVILFVLLCKYFARNHDYWKKRNVYFVKPYPLFGSILPILTLKKTIGEWLWDLCGNIQEDYFGIYVFGQPVLVINSSKLVKAIAVKDFAYFHDRTIETNTDDPIMDNFIFIKKNPDWKRIRSKISPIFTSGKLKAMYPWILHESNEMTDYIATLANVPNVDAKEIAAKYSTNLIAKCAFAVDAQSFKSENAEFRNITKQIFGFSVDTTLRQFGAWLTPGLIKLLKLQFLHPKILSRCNRIFKEVLSARLELKDLKGHNLIDMLIEINRKHDGKYFSDDAMVGHATQFLVAGFETVSSTLSFALYELAIHPELQEKLRIEIKNFIEKENGVSYTAIHELKYLDMVMCETLRKYPVLPFIDRMCKADYKVEGTDFVIEKGTPVYIPMFALHYNPKHFKDPHIFDPERFDDKSILNNDGMFYIPFGAGPRMCIGERFGSVGVKVGIIATLLKFRVEKSDKTPIPIEFEPKSVVLQSKVGLPIKYVPI